MTGARKLFVAQIFAFLAYSVAAMADLRPRHRREEGLSSMSSMATRVASTLQKKSKAQQKVRHSKASVVDSQPQVDHPEASVEDPAVGELHASLNELMEQRKSAVEMQKAIQADTQLLRETAMLVKTTHGSNRVAAGRQLKESERLLKETETMAHQSRAGWAAGAKAALEEADEVREAAKALSEEAAAQVRLFGGPKAAVPEVAKQAAPMQEVAAKAARPAVVTLPKNADAKAAPQEDDDKDDGKDDGTDGGWA